MTSRIAPSPPSPSSHHELNQPPTTSPSTTTETHLIKTSKRLIHLLNTRAYTHPFFYAHVRQNVHTSLSGHHTIGLDPFINNHRLDAKNNKDFFVDADFNVTCLVDEEGGSATVIMSQHLSGFGGRMGGVVKAGTILFAWQRSGSGRKGRWWCADCCMIYGTPEFLV